MVGFLIAGHICHFCPLTHSAGVSKWNVNLKLLPESFILENVCGWVNQVIGSNKVSESW